MIFNSVILHNFGVYRSRQEYNLRPTEHPGPRRPIVLFGGKNGAGKTTILEAINLCLYGPGVVGRAVTKKEYEEYLAQKIHRDSRSRKAFESASVSLEFEYAHGGVQDTYVVSRFWQKNGNLVREELQVKRNGKQLTNVNQDQWNTFIKELVPPGLAQLFFFDGEKIRKLSGSSLTDNIYFADSIKTLLGIDIVERLQRDLVIYCRTYSKERPQPSLQEIDILREREQEVENLLAELRQDRAQLEVRMQRRKNEIISVEEKIAALGGEFFEKYKSLESRRTQLQLEVDEIKEKIRDYCHDVFPLSLCPNLCKKLTERLKEERETVDWNRYRTILENHISRIAHKLESEFMHEPDGTVYGRSSKEISKKILAISQNILDKTALSTTPNILINELSNREIDEILIWLDQALTMIPEKVSHYCGRLEECGEELIKIEADLARSPSEDLLKPSLDTLNRLSQELGGLEQRAALVEEKIKNATLELKNVKKKIQRLNEAIIENDRSSERFKLVARIQTVLTTFSDELKVSKVCELQDTILDLFLQLSRKQNLIGRVQLNSSDFSLKLFDKSGREIPKKNLSSGERQVLAIAMLWALRKVSGRPIPVIIDTPLSRLDSVHRTKLINNYLPYASHQTIILSTDTEINRGYFEQIRNRISHCYHLNFYEERGMTIGEPGYFWKDMRVEDEAEQN